MVLFLLYDYKTLSNPDPSEGAQVGILAQKWADLVEVMVRKQSSKENDVSTTGCDYLCSNCVHTFSVFVIHSCSFYVFHTLIHTSHMVTCT